MSQRMVGVALGAVLCAFTPLAAEGTPSRAAPQLRHACIVPLEFHSAAVTRVRAGSGLVRTTDDTVLIRVRRPSIESTGWTVSPSVGASDPRHVVGDEVSSGLAGVQGFIGDSGRVSEERVDLGGGPTAVTINVLGTGCSSIVRFVPLSVAGAKTSVVAVLHAGSSWGPIALGTIGLRGPNRLEDAFAAFDGAVLRLTGHLRLDARHRSSNIVTLVSDGATPLELADKQGAIIGLKGRPGTDWVAPDLVVEKLPYADGTTAGGGCRGRASLALPDNVGFGVEAAHSVRGMTAVCANGATTGFRWSASDARNLTFISWRTRDGLGSQAFRACPGLTRLAVDLSESAEKRGALSARGVLVYRNESDEDCAAAARRDATTAPKIDDVGLHDTYGNLVPVGHLTATGATFLTKYGFSPCEMDASFDKDGMTAKFSGRLVAQLLVPTPPPMQTGSKPSVAPTPARLKSRGISYACIASKDDAGSDGRKRSALPVAGSSAGASTTDDVPVAPLLDVHVAGVTAHVATKDAPNFTDPGKWENVDFSGATIDVGKNANLFGRAVVQCDSVKDVSGVTKVVATPNTLCIGVRVSPHPDLAAKPESYAKDVAFGLLRLCRSGTADAWGHDFSCPSNFVQPTTTLGIVGFTAQLPTSEPAKVRLGIGSIALSGLTVDAGFDPTRYDDAVGADRLESLGCRGLNIFGTAEAAALDLSNAKTTAILGAEAVAAPTVLATSVVSDPTLSAFSAVPTFGMGGGCSIFAMQGFLPLQLTPQSTIVFTSLVFARSKDIDDADLFFMNASGALTSGNVTVAFRSVGFRTRAKRPMGKDGRPLECVKKDHHETLYGNLCVVSDVNLPLSGAITAAQNSDAILKAITSAGSALLGFAVGRSH